MRLREQKSVISAVAKLEVFARLNLKIPRPYFSKSYALHKSCAKQWLFCSMFRTPPSAKPFPGGTHHNLLIPLINNSYDTFLFPSAARPLMEAGDPQRWDNYMDAVRVVWANKDALSDCRDAAAKAKKKQPCLFVIDGAGED